MSSIVKTKNIKIMIFVVIVYILTILFFGVRMQDKVLERSRYVEIRVLIEDASSEMLLGTDTLSEMIQYYVVTEDDYYKDAFILESEVTKSTANAIDEVDDLAEISNFVYFLKESKHYSDELKIVEYQAIDYVEDGNTDMAIDLIFSNSYMEEKTRIYTNLWLFETNSIAHVDHMISDIDSEYNLYRNLVLVVNFLFAFYVIGNAYVYMKKRKELTEVANLDPLTKVYNRKKFNEEFSSYAKLAYRQSKNLGLIIFDIDDFKYVNDKFGHNEGDEVLKSLAECVSNTIRESDVFARWGGEEFIVLMYDVDEEKVTSTSERIRKEIESHYFANVGLITVSLGCTCSDEIYLVKDMVDKADSALYLAKDTGKNKTVFIGKK